MSASSDYLAPSVFLNHGGGPNPVLGEKTNMEMAKALKNIPNLVDLNRLKSIILVTAHREEDVVTISSGEKHELMYDYSNFPPESYTLKYNAPGNPELAKQIHEAFTKAGITSVLDSTRPWDHGVFIPMLLINPSANIPIVQLSILKNQDAKQHYEIGKALNPFRKQGIAIFGSGMSYHNMQEFKNAWNINDNIVVNENFDTFLNEVCTDSEEGRKRILKWEEQDGGLESHPKFEADHLMPLIVNIGAAGTCPGRRIFEDLYRGKFKLSGFMWG